MSHATFHDEENPPQINKQNEQIVALEVGSMVKIKKSEAEVKAAFANSRYAWQEEMIKILGTKQPVVDRPEKGFFGLAAVNPSLGQDIWWFPDESIEEVLSYMNSEVRRSIIDEKTRKPKKRVSMMSTAANVPEWVDSPGAARKSVQSRVGLDTDGQAPASGRVSAAGQARNSVASAQGPKEQRQSVASVMDLATLPGETREDRDLYREAKAARLPEQVRNQYTRKIWLLLGGQMTALTIVSIICHLALPEFEDLPPKFQIQVRSVGGFSLIILAICLMLLFCSRSVYPLNYIMLTVFVGLEAAFFGMGKWLLGGLLGLQFVGIIALSLLLSGVASLLGVTPWIAQRVKTSYEMYVSDETEAMWTELIKNTECYVELPEVDVLRFAKLIYMRGHWNHEHYVGTYVRMPLSFNGRPCWAQEYNTLTLTAKCHYIYWRDGWCLGPVFGGSNVAYFLPEAPQNLTPLNPYPHQWMVWNKIRKEWLAEDCVGVTEAEPKLFRKYVIPQRLLEHWRINDGLMKATIMLGIISWALACAVDALIIFGPLYTQVNTYGFYLAAFMTFFCCLFFHIQVERQMRRCKVDRFMNAIIYINAELLLVFMVVCVLMGFFGSDADVAADGAGVDADVDVGDGAGDADIGDAGAGDPPLAMPPAANGGGGPMTVNL